MTFEIYKARDGWRWRLKSRNGRIVADSGEAYAKRSSAMRAIRRIAVTIGTGKWVVDA